MKLLLVEDDERISLSLLEALTDQHYVVDLAVDGQEGWDFFEASAYSLVILDIMLPKIDGITLCQRIRCSGSFVPVLMLTAKDTSADKVRGLDVGADDYVVKPFDLKEFLARIRALLRRGGDSLPPVLEWENLQLDPATCTVIYGGKPLNLTPKEYSLLELLLRNNGRVLNPNFILDQLWSFDDPPGKETVKVHIRGLRQKLKAAGASNDFIETVYGLGYRLNPSL